jgi:hypothetical protein
VFPDTKEEQLVETLDSITGTMHAKVILFNDEHHTFDEVIIQILKAIQAKQLFMKDRCMNA